MTERAQSIYDAWEDEYCRQKPFYEHRALASVLRETINQLQKGTTLGAVIMCADVLELCEELESQDKKSEEYEYFHISYRKDAPF